MNNLRCKPPAAVLAAMGALASMISPAWADHVVRITAGRPTSLPAHIPTTVEGVTGDQVEDRINASDSEDALKYLPSLNVRKRYIGDYDHAVLASRASGTGNSARSLVYADGILLSNLLGNGATYAPRWGQVSPEEIERVDVLYGPFSAAYPGNSVGAVVDFQTRMPDRLEAHVKLTGSTQGFRLYRGDARYDGGQASASVGNRAGAWSWWADVSRLDSNGQPVVFANRLVASGKAGMDGVPVTGAVAGRNPTGADWLILGATNQVHTVQDHAKVKLAYDLAAALRASYTLGWWRNEALRTATSYLRDAAGRPVVGGTINADGRSYALLASDFAPSRGALAHVMHGLSLKQGGKGVFEWEAAASRYAYARDQVRTPTVPVATPDSPGAGNLTDMGGSGWTTLTLRGVWRPPDTAHAVEFGVQRDSAHLRTRVTAGADWINAAGGTPVSRFTGDTRLESIYLQDTWRISGAWKATFGVRREQWRAFDGGIANSADVLLPFAGRRESSWSPKAAVSLRASDDWSFKASAGRAVRNPTAQELFQGSIVNNTIVYADPTLRAERSWTGEWSAERQLDHGSLRMTAFHETTRDALHSQPLPAMPAVNTVQNIARIRTRGLELSYQREHVWLHGLSLAGSATWTDSIIAANPALPASVGKRQPRVPDWRATLLASYHVGEHWTSTLGMRYSGRQYGSLLNNDPNGATYMGVSDYLVFDARLRYRFNRQWSAALGIDNVNNRTYWAFHPYTQRTVVAELKFDL